MQHQSLTAQIASKGKKSFQAFEPTFFSEIPYSDVMEINYLRDLEEKKKNIDFPIFQFEKDFEQEAPVNEYDMLANNMYKKIMQNGYIRQKKAPSKKKKKTKNLFDYDYEDAWINDEEAVTVKKNIYVKLQNFKCLNNGVDQFYESEIYKSSIAQIQQMSKKRTNQILMDSQQLEEMKKKIKLNISIAHSKVKQEYEAQKQTNIVQNTQQIQMNLKNQNQNLTLLKFEIQNQSHNFQEKTQIEKDLGLLKQQILEINEKSQLNIQKDSQIIEKEQVKKQLTQKKTKKTTAKQKSTVPKKKKEKNPKLTEQKIDAVEDEKNQSQEKSENPKSNQFSPCSNVDKNQKALIDQADVENAIKKEIQPYIERQNNILKIEP